MVSMHFMDTDSLNALYYVIVGATMVLGISISD